MAAYSFNTTTKEKNKLGNLFFQRVKFILDENDIKYEDKILVEFILKHFPDYRKILNELQKYSLDTKYIDIGIFATSSTNISEYMEYLVNKDFKNARKYIGENSLDGDFYSILYHKILEHKDYPKEAIANSILIIAKYQYQHAFAIDQQLNISAMTIELMAGL